MVRIIFCVKCLVSAHMAAKASERYKIIILRMNMIQSLFIQKQMPKISEIYTLLPKYYLNKQKF